MLVLVTATIIIFIITFTTVKNKQDFMISEFLLSTKKKKVIDR